MTPEDTPRDAVPPSAPDNRTVHLRQPAQPADARPADPRAADPRVAAPAPAPEPAPVPDNATVQLGGGAGTGFTPPPPTPPPTVFAAPAPPPEAEPQPSAESLIRFGPGVPDPKTARTMAVWTGAAPAGAAAAAAEKPKRKPGRYALAAVVLLAVVGYLVWRTFFGTALAVDSATVTAGPAGLSCGGTETFVANLHTNGAAGTIHYYWQRSDGANLGPFTQTVTSGPHQVPITFRWSVQGQGSFQGTATLKVTSPGSATAAATFSYSC